MKKYDPVPCYWKAQVAKSSATSKIYIYIYIYTHISESEAGCDWGEITSLNIEIRQNNL